MAGRCATRPANSLKNLVYIVGLNWAKVLGEAKSDRVARDAGLPPALQAQIPPNERKLPLCFFF